jgi:methylated-DNA-[protein]-cysteine S-methyltransferase
MTTEAWLAWTVVEAPVPLRALTLGVTEVGVVLICFGAGTGAVRAQLAAAGRRLEVTPVEDAERAEPAATELADYLARHKKTFDAPIDWRLTHGDQQVVLRTLYEDVSYGETITYGELAVRSGAYATELGAGQAARRVGAIMGSNPVPVIVPCHRVLAANGLGGFGGGLESKRWLLDLEGAQPPMLDLW